MKVEFKRGKKREVKKVQNGVQIEDLLLLVSELEKRVEKLEKKK